MEKTIHFVPFPELITDRLLLRQTVKTDAKEVLFSRSNKEMNKYIRREPPVNIKEAEGFVEKVTRGLKNGENINWSITLHGNPKMIGSICLWNFSPDKKTAEVGYDLHTAFQRQGIMDEALKSVVEFGFKTLNLDHIEAFTHYQNEASKKLLMKNNFLHIESRKDEEDPNNIIFELKNMQNKEFNRRQETMKRTFLLACICLLFLQCKTSETIVENTPKKEPKAAIKQEIYKPKLVVGIVVDQMRYDYLTRFWDRFGEEGFKRLISEGYNLKNNHFNYVPTFTGPGHASIYTGSTPETHGIISNYWYNKFQDKSVYCVADASVKPVGTKSFDGKKSPQRVLVTTVADQNRLHTQMRGKTIGISLKDRSAILPAGHTANATYWFHGEKEGKFISSSFYMEELPVWVQNFNASEAAENYLKVWDTYEPIETYTESGPDLNNFEHGFEGKETATFPYDLAKLKTKNDGFSILKSTPYGNSLTVDFAIAALEGENLGKDKTTDFLAVSFSGTDYVGHNFGVNSKEIEDTYIRLDRDLARFLKALDTKVGKGNYTLFLTADHGGVQVPAYLKTQQIPAGYFDSDSLQNALGNFTMKEYGADDLIENVSNNQIFFDYQVLKENNVPAKNLQNNLLYFLLQYPKINKVFTRSMLQNTDYTEGIGALVQNGFHQKRSGDVIYTLKPNFISYSKKGSTHGSGFNYDTHVPLIFFGKGISHGETTRRSEITDIAPTISALLGIAFPNGATGEVLYYVID